MTTEKPTISEEAAQWAVRIQLGPLSEAQRAELDAWVAADARHEGALARARAAWFDLDRLAALAAGRTSSEVLPPDEGAALAGSRRQQLPRQSAKRRMSRRVGWGSLVAGLGAIALLGALWLASHVPAHTYVSGVGELRKVPLADGSLMTLNTATQARVAFDEHRRSVRLESGEAMFEVAKDASRPFVVRSGAVTVTAIGTAFVVRTDDPASVAVTVTEGVVEIDDPRAARPALRVAANERVLIEDRGPLQLEHSPPRVAERRLAWRNGMIQFDAEPLGAAVAEFNRYSRRRIVVEDPVLAARPITGIFRTSDIEEFAQVTAAVLDADAAREGDTIHLRSR